MALFSSIFARQKKEAASTVKRKMNEYGGHSLIDDITKDQILGLLDFNVFGASSDLVDKKLHRAQVLAKQSIAQKTPLFQSRHFFSERARMMRERPGRDQLILTDRSAMGQAAGELLNT